MVDRQSLISIADYQFGLRSEKINSIARLVKLNIPTVPLPHVLSPAVYQFYLQSKKLPLQAEQELKVLFVKLQKAGYSATVRPSIFSEIPGAEFFVANSLNLPTFKEVVKAITEGYEKVRKEFKQPEKIEFSYLIQGFYTANKAGVVFSDDGSGQVYIEAAFGENTNIFTRGEVQPDVYKVDKQTGEIKERQIAAKQFTLEVSESGLRQVKLKEKERIKPVFTDKEIEKIYQYSLRMEKEYGPQEIECAVLRTGELIFQSARTSQIGKQKALGQQSKNIPVFSQPVQGEIIFLNELGVKENLSQKVVITDNLDIDFITRLVYRFRPKGGILTRGSLTAHAVTILREAKVPSVLATGLRWKKQKLIEIKSNGEVLLR